MLFEIDDERDAFTKRLAKRHNEEVDSSLSKNFDEKTYINYVNGVLQSINEELEKINDNELSSFKYIFKLSNVNSLNAINDVFDTVNFTDKCNDFFKLLLFEHYEWDIDEDDETESSLYKKELHEKQNEIFELRIELFKETLIYEAELGKLKEAMLNIRKASNINARMKKYKDEFVVLHDLKEKICSLKEYIIFTEKFSEKLNDYFQFNKEEFINRIPIYVFTVFCYALLNNIEEANENEVGMHDFYNERKIVLKAPVRRDKPDIYKDDYIKSMKIDLKRYCYIDKYINVTGAGEKKINKALSYFWFNSLTRYNDILTLGKLGCEIIDDDISYESEDRAKNKITAYANILSDGVFSNKLLLDNFKTKKLFESEKIGKTYRLLIDKLNKYISLSIKDLSHRIYREIDVDKVIISELSNEDDLSEIVSKIISQVLIDIEAIEEASDNERMHYSLFYAYNSIYKSKLR